MRSRARCSGSGTWASAPSRTSRRDGRGSRPPWRGSGTRSRAGPRSRRSRSGHEQEPYPDPSIENHENAPGCAGPRGHPRGRGGRPHPRGPDQLKAAVERGLLRLCALPPGHGHPHRRRRHDRPRGRPGAPRPGEHPRGGRARVRRGEGVHRLALPCRDLRDRRRGRRADPGELRSDPREGVLRRGERQRGAGGLGARRRAPPVLRRERVPRRGVDRLLSRAPPYLGPSPSWAMNPAWSKYSWTSTIIPFWTLYQEEFAMLTRLFVGGIVPAGPLSAPLCVPVIRYSAATHSPCVIATRRVGVMSGKAVKKPLYQPTTASRPLSGTALSGEWSTTFSAWSSPNLFQSAAFCAFSMSSTTCMLVLPVMWHTPREDAGEGSAADKPRRRAGRSRPPLPDPGCRSPPRTAANAVALCLKAAGFQRLLQCVSASPPLLSS